MKEIELKSSTVETAVIQLINKFLDEIIHPDLQEGKYDWLSPDKALRPVGSTSKLHMGADAGTFLDTPQSVVCYFFSRSFQRNRQKCSDRIRFDTQRLRRIIRFLQHENM